jgi:hypothetical protein
MPGEVPPQVAGLAGGARFGRLVRSFTARRNLQLSSEDVYVFEHGGVFVAGRREPVVIAWEQVAQFYQAVTREKHLVDKVTYQYRFVLRDGTDRKVRAATVMGVKSGLEEFGPLMDDLIGRAIVPRLLRTILDGGAVSFNTFRLDADGISDAKRERRVAWAEVGNIRFRQVGRSEYQGYTSVPMIVIAGRADEGLLGEKAAITCNHAALFTIVKRFIKREVMPSHPARRAREPLAAARGWKFAARDTKESYRKLGALFGYPVGEAVHGRLVGNLDGRTFGLFDVVTGNGLDRTLWFVVLADKVPFVAVTARTGSTPPDRARATGDPAFDDAYESASREPGAVERLLTPAVRQRILQTRPVRLVLAGTLLVHATPFPDADAIPAGLRDLASIAALVPAGPGK